MMFSLLHGVLGMVLCIAIMPGFLRRFTTDPALVDMGVTYSTIVFLFSLVVLCLLLVRSPTRQRQRVRPGLPQMEPRAAVAMTRCPTAL